VTFTIFCSQNRSGEAITGKIHKNSFIIPPYDLSSQVLENRHIQTAISALTFFFIKSVAQLFKYSTIFNTTGNFFLLSEQL
jgi:hypothetical protein